MTRRSGDLTTVLSENNWAWDFMMKAISPKAPEQARQALDSLISARMAATTGDKTKAFEHYKRAMIQLFEADETDPGGWAKELVKVNREYGSKFLDM